MSKRLQVLLDEAELHKYQRLAELAGVTLAAWVREALRQRCQTQPSQDVGRKLAAVRRAAAFAAPAPPMAQMKQEIIQSKQQAIARSLAHEQDVPCP
ncbi:MAG: antitoxin [Polyangiales bacterium]